LIYVLFFVGVTAIWGWTFVVVKNAITQYPTLPFLQLRFLLAFLVMVVLVRRLPTRRELLVGLAAGAVLAMSYLTQTLGLNLISPGNAGLITGLLVLFTPLVDRLFGVPLKRRTIVAVILAVVGIGMVTGGPSAFGLGDLLVLLCAVFLAFHIVMLSRWSPGLRAAPLAMVQMGACALIFSAGGTWSLRAPNADVWVAIVITGVLASALAFYIQTWAQAHIDASRTALIIAMEPAWAVAAAVVLAGQRFGLLQAAGAALVLAAIVGHELAPLKFKAPEHEPIET
jgi:drug/metabolite transporter (DMT)-like permease